MVRNIRPGQFVTTLMARRLAMASCALVFAFVALAAQSVTVPGRVLACSCAPPPSLAEAAADPSNAIVLATIGGLRGNGREVAVEGSFGPVVLGEAMIVRGFGPEGSACEHGGTTGQRWFFVLYRDSSGQYSISNCSLSGQIGTNEGDALLFEAITAFGEPASPSTPPPQPQAPVDLTPWLGGLGWVAAITALGAAIFVLVVLVAKRRPSG